MFRLLSSPLCRSSNKIIFRPIVSSVDPQPKTVIPDLPETKSDPLQQFDYFGVSSLFTVKSLFDNRLHLGHTQRSLTPGMAPFVFGTRFDMCLIDLDQTAQLLRQALNFTAHTAYKGGIILFVCRQPSLVHLTDRAARECGEYSHTRSWKTETFTATNITFGQEVRLPDLVVMVHTKERHQYGDHRAIIDCGKVAIPTVGLVDTDCNPNMITYPVPGNDDSQDSVAMFLHLVKQSILLGKQKKQEDQQLVRDDN